MWWSMWEARQCRACLSSGWVSCTNVVGIEFKRSKCVSWEWEEYSGMLYFVIRCLCGNLTVSTSTDHATTYLQPQAATRYKTHSGRRDKGIIICSWSWLHIRYSARYPFRFIYGGVGQIHTMKLLPSLFINKREKLEKTWLMLVVGLVVWTKKGSIKLSIWIVGLIFLGRGYVTQFVWMWHCLRNIANAQTLRWRFQLLTRSWTVRSMTSSLLWSANNGLPSHSPWLLISTSLSLHVPKSSSSTLHLQPHIIMLMFNAINVSQHAQRALAFLRLLSSASLCSSSISLRSSSMALFFDRASSSRISAPVASISSES